MKSIVKMPGNLKQFHEKADQNSESGCAQSDLMFLIFDRRAATAYLYHLSSAQQRALLRLLRSFDDHSVTVLLSNQYSARKIEA